MEEMKKAFHGALRRPDFGELSRAERNEKYVVPTSVGQILPLAH
jgi:hypothetical protein